ncbi:PREDICTED: 2-acylglycerol O-acyltransferase 2-like isoform X2 [Vollenhovia emeryi]|uniref:2-acylglycerol O-acyltransferase 2-like isoform X2 n=1 Tax=Vollenhovia emeryi TaxID=411798 RepID=UPI0005F466A7|nr:PREDICTED: 2-acylglycerol O-acyltransferase 2-like isoform X2 [Vollenhovia emeryi]
MEILGVKFAPLNVPLKRRLQTLAAATWTFAIGFGDIWGYLITAYLLLYTDITRYFLLLYFLWMYYDWDTCHRGGRTGFIRNGRNGLQEIISRTRTTSHYSRSTLQSAFIQRMCLFFSVRSLKHLLSTPPKKPYTGKATILVVGGMSELMESTPGTYRIDVKRRKGFVKLALKHGTSLVPVLSFGETDLYNQIYRPEGSTFRRIQNYIRSFIGIPPVVVWGRGFFQYSFGLIPKRLPVTVVVGSPIELPKITDPTPEEIDTYHDKFTKQLIELFETQKHNYIKNAEKVTLEFNV